MRKIIELAILFGISILFFWSRTICWAHTHMVVQCKWILLRAILVENGIKMTKIKHSILFELFFWIDKLFIIIYSRCVRWICQNYHSMKKKKKKKKPLRFLSWFCSDETVIESNTFPWRKKSVFGAAALQICECAFFSRTDRIDEFSSWNQIIFALLQVNGFVDTAAHAIVYNWNE